MASKVSVGKTSPVPLGQQPAANSLPVVFAEDQAPIPVEEQNKIQSEVALSLLGIPRAEVALGIFADVNTYDVNPSEWAQFPASNTPAGTNGIIQGVEHIPTEAGARLVAPDVKTTVLTSKRFFRYQPGRVSASTMGVKMNVTLDPDTLPIADRDRMVGAPSIKKWGIFDKFDGYYFEIANAGLKNDFRCVRRTQAIIPSEPLGYGTGDLSWFNNGGENAGEAKVTASTNFGVAGLDPVIIRDGLVYVAAAIYDPSLVYAPASVNAIDVSGDPSGTLKNYTPDPNYAVRLATTVNGTTYSEVMNGRHYQFPFDQSTTPLADGKDPLNPADGGYSRIDGHCNFYKTISNLNRKLSDVYCPQDKTALDPTKWGLTSGASFSGYSTTVIDSTWDSSPSNSNRSSKVWHLLVNVQGSTKIATNAISARNNFSSGDKTMTQRIAEAEERKDYSLRRIGGVSSRTIDAYGNLTLKEWFNLCVPKPLRMVYEWRPPRAMFSGDKLNGPRASEAEKLVRWSDVNTSAEDTTGGSGSVVNLPGEVIRTSEGEQLKANSVYKIDFSKVTMWKIEFSWYGAVGAIFLCYVPVGNNEARWVRVHHIRASNQHSVASLGNATLPITYLTHGGPGSGLETTDIGNTLVKYGASYYIDGGDKGTVRLLSKASDFSREVPKGFYDFASGSWTWVSATQLKYNSTTHTTLPPSVAVGLMGAYLANDSTAKVKWITQEGASSVILQFTKDCLGLNHDHPVRLIIPRVQRSLMTVRAKDFIYNRDGKPVRNRLQIYPIKYGAGVTGGTAGELLTLRALKNPLFIVTNSSTDLGNYVGSNQSNLYTVRNHTNTSVKYVDTGKSTLPVQVGFVSGEEPGLSTGKYRYGYFLGTTVQNPTANSGYVTTSPSTCDPILGKLFRTSDGYFFEKLFSYPDNIYILGPFVPERHLIVSSTGTLSEKVLSLASGVAGSSASTDQGKWNRLEEDELANWEDITRLSGAQIAQDLSLTPVPDTGNEIFSYYAGSGGYQFDLQDYFAYNKEYLSFPLTDEVDIINLQGHYEISNTTPGASGAGSVSFKVNNALTWEEQ